MPGPQVPGPRIFPLDPRLRLFPLYQQTPLVPAPSDIAEHVITGACSELDARQLFAGADGNGDDRIDLLEAAAAELVPEVRDLAAFARVDTDRDGLIAWPEFDTLLQATLRRGGAFNLRTPRIARSSPPAAPRTPAEALIDLHDTDRDGALAMPELAAWMDQTDLPPAMLLTLVALDSDRSSRIDADELAPVFAVPAATKLPVSWPAGDVDNSGSIDGRELDRLLQRRDPALRRWSASLLRRFDRSADGVLQADELPESTPAARPDDDGQLPARSSVR